MVQEKKLRITLVKSKYGRKPRHRECIEGLGLRRIHQTVEVTDIPANRGMIDKVSYLLMIDEEV
ncbi:50S ribosomal protein L30 [Coxiella endosymbiont of Ornithodoros amblus]|uniref:50S ribosomal protein L30 n=1 Tax=Coxiella endosymbiont of Ornithodoros amblus TaxID=1656166 RepID=UPI00244DCA29|nr:50S ribosomal protein L30 [Coxiella endosymbiont of Ornithodoros amblus]MBW5802533.1 50S ribosomal protein L30 [Coxiella endosymbiont of Ornithodoros amblus]